MRNNLSTSTLTSASKPEENHKDKGCLKLAKNIIPMIHSFTDMEVWQRANKLAIEVFKLTVSLPRSEDYALTSQIRRSSSSVSANIAEGFGRRTNKDKNYFYTIARGSAFETQSHLKYGNGVGYFTEEDTNKFFTEYKELIHQLNKIMKSLG